MMNKMKMEDKERKDAHQQKQEARRKELGVTEASSGEEFVSPTSPEEPQTTREELRRYRAEHGRRGRGRGGGNLFN